MPTPIIIEYSRPENPNQILTITEPDWYSFADWLRNMTENQGSVTVHCWHYDHQNATSDSSHQPIIDALREAGGSCSSSTSIRDALNRVADKLQERS